MIFATWFWTWSLRDWLGLAFLVTTLMLALELAREIGLSLWWAYQGYMAECERERREQAEWDAQQERLKTLWDKDES